MLLTTPRLLIRPLNLQDAPFVLELLNTPGWLQNIGDREVRNLSQAEAYIRGILSKDQVHYSVIEHSTEKKAIGVLSYMQREHLEHPDVGFALLPTYEGQGVAYEATQAYLSHRLAVERPSGLLAIALKTNVRSTKLLVRLGFERTYSYQEGEAELDVFGLKIKEGKREP